MVEKFKLRDTILEIRVIIRIYWIPEWILNIKNNRFKNCK